MKMIDQAHAKKGVIRSFTSYCGGLPSPAAANNPLAYKFRSVFLISVVYKLFWFEYRNLKSNPSLNCGSWNPAGAIKVGQNPATYKNSGEIIHIDGTFLKNVIFVLKFGIFLHLNDQSSRQVTNSMILPSDSVFQNFPHSLLNVFRIVTP